MDRLIQNAIALRQAEKSKFKKKAKPKSKHHKFDPPRFFPPTEAEQITKYLKPESKTTLEQ